MSAREVEQPMDVHELIREIQWMLDAGEYLPRICVRVGLSPDAIAARIAKATGKKHNKLVRDLQALASSNRHFSRQQELKNMKTAAERQLQSAGRNLPSTSIEAGN